MTLKNEYDPKIKMTTKMKTPIMKTASKHKDDLAIYDDLNYESHFKNKDNINDEDDLNNEDKPQNGDFEGSIAYNLKIILTPSQQQHN